MAVFCQGDRDPSDDLVLEVAAHAQCDRIVTFNVVCFAWIFFRADSLATAQAIITGLFTQWDAGSPLVTAGVLAAILAGLVWQYLPARLGELTIARFSRLGVALQGAALAVSLTIVAALGPDGVAPFIYFRF